MAKLKATNYMDLVEDVFEGETNLGTTREIGYATTATIVENDWGAYDIQISLHGNTILRLEHDSGFKGGPVNFTLAGWPTKTTSDRVNQFISNDFTGDRSVKIVNEIPHLDGEPIEDNEWYRISRRGKMDYRLEIYGPDGTHVVTKNFFKEEIEEWNDGVVSPEDLDFFMEDEVAREFGVESSYGSSRSNYNGTNYFIYEPSSNDSGKYLGAGRLEVLM